MNEFNDWWNEKMTNKHQSSDLQFTELTPDDIAIHENIYIDMLVGLAHRPSGTYWHIYREYAIEETLKAKQLFCETFK